MPRDEKPPFMHQFFVSSLNELAGYKATYINWKDFNTTNEQDIPNLSPPQYYTDLVSTIRVTSTFNAKDIDIFRKTYFALSYFYYETNYRWVHRGTVDNSINVGILDKYYESLEEKYDPLKQPVILGGCIKNRVLSFLQGGSGYLYSRKAVELILPHYENIIRSCASHEDVCHNKFIQFLNISIYDASSTHFLGHNFLANDIKRLMAKSFDDLEKCPKLNDINDTLQCRRFHAPINQIVSLHQHAKTVAEAIELCRSIFSADNEIHFYFPEGSTSPQLCRD
ncbi:hypothetical protein GPJ56_008779 [Histomonas meleagridis]|uniref:uncharacterized protein n=1 Tax=Histomonas meleagridis TaxID=135588 RepID=UPI00355A51A7|nr:hypothetical protein GPJ56_008779 [Histomonas meleagridis]KAH0805429.1 hypothetical protein GO595_001811 [Histomonas meleagridis]